MKWTTRLQKRHHLITALILLIGLGSSALIYLTADNEPDNDVFYEYQHSKKYKHDLELYGGKANVLANDFIRWFSGLWQGRSLALTSAVITLFISFGYFFVASRLDHAAGDEDHRDGPG
ncbi:MAG: hypothetical protein WA610_12720 [Thermodesulfovibrionales bacterium]